MFGQRRCFGRSPRTKNTTAGLRNDEGDYGASFCAGSGEVSEHEVGNLSAGVFEI